MKWLPTALLFVSAWLAAFAATQFPWLARILGAGPNLLPSLISHAALRAPAWVVAALALFGGAETDSVASQPVGVSALPLLVIAFLIHQRRRLILSDQVAAQMWLGLGAGLLAPTATLCLLALGSRPVLTDWGNIWPILASGALNTLGGPLWARLFAWAENTFGEKTIASTSFRADREIKRGRN